MFRDFRDFGFLVCADIPVRREHDGAWEGLLHKEPEAVWMEAGSNQPSVLSHNVKIMEGPEKGVPSVIRFQRFDKLSIGTGKRLYEFGSLVIPCDETGAAFCDRKRDVLGSPRYAVAIGECSSEDIKATADRVDVSASFHIEKARKRCLLAYQKLLVRYMRAWIYDGYFRVFVPPEIESLIEGLEMGYGPIDAGLSI
jgi:hypothetical protein